MSAPPHASAPAPALVDGVDARTRAILDKHDRANVARRARLVGRVLVLADCVALTAAFGIAKLAFPDRPLLEGTYTGRVELELFLVTLPAWLLVARLYGLYERDAEHADHSTADDAPAIVNMLTLAVWLLLVVSRLTEFLHPDFRKLAAFWAAGIVSMLLARWIARLVANRSLTFVQNAVIFGAGDVGQLVGRKLLHHPEYGINLVGFVDDNPRSRRDDLGRLCILGSRDDLSWIVQRYDVERVIVAFSAADHEASLETVRELVERGVQVDIVPRLFEVVGPGAVVHSVEGLPLVALRVPRLSRSSRLLKRTMDVIGATFALAVLAPLFAAVAVAIKLDSSGPVFFRQARVGTRGRRFRIWKFRTMVAEAEEHKGRYAHLNMHLAPGGDPRMFKIANDPRTTRVGRALRRFSIDELPQLLNVVVGEMSLVGPRPLIPDESRHVTAWAMKRLALQPGMTGLWQVLGRHSIPFDEMVRLDYIYVNTWSVWNDLRILARTMAVVLRPGSAY